MSVTETETFAYDLIREDVLGEILGEHTNDILYWAGKSLARKHPLELMDEAPAFFQRAHFGELSVEKMKKSETIYVLSAPKTEGRCFTLEAGFLAQQKQAIDGFLTEAYVEVQAKKSQVWITLKSDSKERV